MSAGPAIIRPACPRMQNDTRINFHRHGRSSRTRAPDDVGRLGQIVVVEGRIDQRGLVRLVRFDVEHLGGHGATG